MVVIVVAAGAGVSAAGIGPLSGIATDLSGLYGDSGQAPSSDGGGSSVSGASSGDGGGSSDGDSSSSDEGGSSASSGDGPSDEAFSITVVSIEKCGQTCRDVTMRLVNKRNETMTGVGIDATLYAGKGTDGKNIWEGSADVGEMEPEGRTEITRRVELGFGDALAVNDNDGWVTVETVVTSDSESATFTEEKDVL